MPSGFSPSVIFYFFIPAIASASLLFLKGTDGGTRLPGQARIDFHHSVNHRFDGQQPCRPKWGVGAAI
jgi:hypothetical protein